VTLRLFQAVDYHFFDDRGVTGIEIEASHVLLTSAREAKCQQDQRHLSS
jgi:hypothetical protein